MKTKLTSRKFWFALATIISGILMMFGYAESSIEVVSGAVMVIGGSISFMFSEGMVDAARVKSVVEAASDIVQEVEKNEVQL